MEATIFTVWIHDHLLPHAEKVKVAHPLMLQAIAQLGRKTTRSMLARSLTVCAAISCRSADGLYGDLRSAPHLALLASAATADGADEEQGLPYSIQSRWFRPNRLYAPIE
jgi:hypothetical protein